MVKKRRNVSKKDAFWKELKKETRGKYNNKYKKKKNEVASGELDYNEEAYAHPKDVTLDQAISHVISAHGDVEIVFKEDASEEEIERIVEIFQSVK